MRAALFVVVVGCGGSPGTPAHLEAAGHISVLSDDMPATFDTQDRLLLMDGSSGLRRLVGSRLDVVPGAGLFTFGRFGVDRDGAVLLGSLQTLQLARLEADDRVTLINPPPPNSFFQLVGTPSGAYWIGVRGFNHSFVLSAPNGAWVESTRQLDRTLRAPDGTIYAIENGDIVQLGSDDSPQTVASCAEFAGGTCPDLQLGGVDADGAIYMARDHDPVVHILDPSSATFREVSLPGKLTIATMAAGSQLALVLAIDPDRNNEQSLWVVPQGGTELLRFTTVATTQFTSLPPRLLIDHAGNAFAAIDDQLQAVVLD